MTIASNIAKAAALLIFIVVTQAFLVSANHPEAVWLWCGMAGLCGYP